MTRLVAFVLCLAAVGVGSPARAGDAPDASTTTTDTSSRPVDLELAGFIATDGPGGDLGYEAQLGLGRWFAIAFDYGGEIFGHAQTAVQARLRAPVDRFTFYGALGGARGVLRDTQFFHFCGDDSGCPAPPPASTTPAEFVTVEAGVEARASIVFARLFVGDKALLNADVACGYEQDCRAQVPYAGLAAGLRF